ncbi:hypothetical protein [Salibacter halophilus]|uniref:Outer membrane beta-barrel protein n=1 Tax=Salibacter halophilus TaxID=1803916 RepID=A0A6N6M6Y7_9FLAO|nr:hypothetical protein [Salibacter halophilus]KAB1065682.1 hypothetical protein F3059_03230 [Salibacter halophilus]
MKTIILVLVGSLFCQFLTAQVYTEKQTRHRFAQLNFGADLATNVGGKSHYLTGGDQLNEFDFPLTHQPRLIIGGTHFWGHADFTISFPLLNSRFSKNDQDVYYRSGVETAFKFYPWRIENKSFRPYLGIALSTYQYEQDNKKRVWSDGPNLQVSRFPLLAGFTYNYGNQLFELGVSYNYDNTADYYLSEIERASVELSPFQLHLSYRYMLETTLSAEKSWESGKTQEVTQKLAERGDLNSFFVGAGFSSTFWLNESSYNKEAHPYIEKYPISNMPDFALGYYLHKPDLNFTLAYRGYESQTGSYGVDQNVSRNSLGLEVTKFLFDYHGFDPFIGPVVSYENLSFTERVRGVENHDIEDQKFAYGVTFGWDIRPNRIQSWILRTNLRWYPKLDLSVGSDQNISFDNLEFNFIQLIVFPERLLD